MGEPTRHQLEAYERAWNRLKFSIEKTRPRATTADIASCWPTAQELGFKSEEEAFLLELGHGIGLSHRERPLISGAISFDYPVRIPFYTIWVLPLSLALRYPMNFLYSFYTIWVLQICLALCGYVLGG